MTEAYWPTVMSYSAISQAERFEDVATLASNSTVVVDAVVQDVMPTWTSARKKDGGPGVRHHGMLLEVRRVLRGGLATETGRRTIVENLGRVRDPLPRETLRGVFFLVHDTPGPLDAPGAERYYHLISSQGLLVPDRNGVARFPLEEFQDSPIIRSVDGRTFDDVVDQVLSDRAPASPAAGSASPPGCAPRGNP